MKHPIGQTTKGTWVYVDLIQSQAAKQIARQPHILNLVIETLKHIKLKDIEVSIEYDMGRLIGYNFIIKTVGTDGIFYAQFPKDKIYTRFIKNGRPSSTRYLSMILDRDNKGAYELRDAWIGRMNPPRPGSAEETPQSRPYWSTHAMVLSNEPLQISTITKICPY